jgi:protein TonB
VSVRGAAAVPAAGRIDLPACALGAVLLHAAALLCCPAAGLSTPARLELRSGDISLEVSLPAGPAGPAVPEVEAFAVPEPAPPARPEPLRDQPVPAEVSDPEDLARPPAGAALPEDALPVPRAVIEPVRPPRAEPRPSAGTSGNPCAGVARHYVRHPDEGRRRVREAVVRVRLRVLASGKVGAAEVLEPSGHADLDAAAVQGLLRASCVPAQRDGRPADSDLEVAVYFRERRGQGATVK